MAVSSLTQPTAVSERTKFLRHLIRMTRMRARTCAWLTIVCALGQLWLLMASAKVPLVEESTELELLVGTNDGQEDLLALRKELLTPSARDAFMAQLRDTIPDTVPPHVQCNKVERCDTNKVCVVTCARGSVVVDPWLQRVLRLQRKLAYRDSFCHAHLPGTHNSAINLADGYGVEDHVFEGYLHYFAKFKKGMEVHTNDQLFSLTDQLNMGIRFIELDVHWFNNDLHIAHCGGFRLGLLDGMISVFNYIAKWLGTGIEWDSGTIGCKPSLSSIPASEQRRLDDALGEVAAWLHDPVNADEFLMIFFDDESNLFRWNKVTALLTYLKTHFHEEEILLPSDLVLMQGWPYFQTLLEMGKRVIFMSGSNYSPLADELLFVKNEICNWTEPALPFDPYPECHFVSKDISPLDHHRWIFRPQTSEIVYGFLNADGHFGENVYVLNETSLPPLMECGVNLPSPDNITPQRMESMVWVLHRPHQLVAGQCVAIVRATGSPTWTSVDCNQSGFVAACSDVFHHRRWLLGPSAVAEKDANASCSQIDSSFVYRAPTNGFTNKRLHSLLMAAPPSVAGVWLDIRDLVSDIFAPVTEPTTTTNVSLPPVIREIREEVAVM